MILRRSSYIHQVPLAEVVHAIRHVRLPVDQQINALIEFFAEPRCFPEDCQAIVKSMPYSPEAIATLVRAMLEHNILTEKTPAQEAAALQADLLSTHGRDPAEMLERYRRKMGEGVNPYWAVSSTCRPSDFVKFRKRVDVLLFGECDIQMESDFLRREAAQRGVDLRVFATFPDDVALAAERAHDLVFIGGLRARHSLMAAPASGQHAHFAYIAQVQATLRKLREKTVASILIDNLPEPTVEPLGIAERGITGHHSRFRLANVALAEVAASMSDVHVVDVAAALAAAGSEWLIDDALVGFTHFGSPGWMLQRPAGEKAAVHGIFPDMAPLAAWLGGDPYLRESTLARAHLDALTAVLGIGRKKCVIVELDGTLWPGVLAETSRPFAWAPDISGAFSYVGLYFGIHEALLCLKKRGVVLACVSKNDEKIVRELWNYPSTYPHQRLLVPDDFVTWRVNWDDKVENIKSIAEELGFAWDALLFIDDHPVERDRVRQRLPEIEVWGDDPFSLRRMLLKDPRLQWPAVTEESSRRTALMKSHIERQHLRAEIRNEEDYLASLNIQCRMERLAEDSGLMRVAELFERTTQFNTTGRKFSVTELRMLMSNPAAQIFSLHVSDRFGDQGLTGCAVIVSGEILGLVLSCRALGMGIEHEFLRQILAQVQQTLTGQIVDTPRNIPVRNFYRANGFSEIEPGRWRLSSGQHGFHFL